MPWRKACMIVSQCVELHADPTLMQVTCATGETSEIMLSLQQQLQASIPLSPLLHT